MGLYKYIAIDSENGTTDGVLDAPDKEAVVERLVRQGLRPLDIRRHHESPKASFSFLEKFRQNKLTKADVDFFTNQIGLLLNSGLSLDASLRVMKQHSHKPAFKEFTRQVEQKLKEGKSFSQALADYPNFSSMYINIVKAGEEGGILPAMLIKISEYQDTFKELRQFVISASIYPIFLLVVGMAAITILMTTILPRFEVLFEGLGHQLPFHVQILMDTAKAIGHHPFITLLAVIIPPAAIISYMRTHDGKTIYDRLALKAPLLSGFIKDLETTRIFRTLEVLVNNGVHLATALKISSGVANNAQFRHLLNKATVALKEGKQIGKKLKGEGLFPEMAADLLSIGEESGRVGQVCGRIADHYEKELRIRVKRIIALIEPVFILLIAVIAGYIVMSMLSVILSINEIAG